jgi:hypothetical protein
MLFSRHHQENKLRKTNHGAESKFVEKGFPRYRTSFWSNGTGDLAQEDGRTAPTDADFKKARQELSGVTEDLAPEVSPGDENLTSWNENADIGGHAVHTSPPDQDVDVGLELVQEGVEEADMDQRRAAKDEDRP